MILITGTTITKIFLKRVKLTPNAPGFMHKTGRDWRTLTFREFHRDCRMLSFGLMQLGLQPGDKVALLSSTRLEWSLFDMAILGARAVTVPIYPSSTAEDTCHILAHSEARFVVVENEKALKKVLEAIQKKAAAADGALKVEKIIVIDPVLDAKGGPSSTPAIYSQSELREHARLLEAAEPNRFDVNLDEAGPEDLITICYTSGTTGVPKGVLLTHANMASVIEDSAHVLQGMKDLKSITILSFLPVSHIFGKIESMLGYALGWRQAFAENLDKLMTNMNEVRPNLVFSVPRIFEKAFARISSSVAAEPPAKRRLFDWALASGRRYWGAIWSRKTPAALDAAQYLVADRLVFKKIRALFGGNLKYVVSGGAPLAKEIGEYFQVLGIQILEGYGLTETCAPVTLNPPGKSRYGTVGRPLPEVSLKIAEDGEILVKSRKVFPGYYKMEQETREALQGGWFHTGDIGVIEKDGYLRITDRKKDLIVTSGGKNVAPQKLESLAKSHNLLSQLVVIGDQKHFLTALVVLDREQAIKFASEQQILFSEFSELIRNHKILALVQRVIDQINSGLASFETIKKFVIVPNEFTVESGELTPSLKIRRKIVQQRYKSEIESMYSA